MKAILASLSGRPPFFDSLIPDRGLAQLSAVLTAAGIDNQVHDLNQINIALGEFIRIVEREKPDFVGFKFFDSGYVATELIARAIRREMPGIRLIAGGPHVTLFQEAILNDTDAFDLVISGDGEQAIIDVANWIDGTLPISQVRGAIYRGEDGCVHKNPAPVIQDLDALPFPDWEVFQLERYLPIGLLNTYRGCPFTCAFCAHNRVWGYQEEPGGYKPLVRSRSLQSLRLELEKTTGSGLRLLGFTDSTPLPPLFRLLVAEFPNYGVRSWTSFAYVGHFREADFNLFAKTNCAALWFGIESGSEELRKVMGKSFTNLEVARTFQLAESAKIVAIPGFIVGFPGDSMHHWNLTKALLQQLMPRVHVISPYILDPGSPVALNPAAFSVELTPDWQSRIVRRLWTNEFEVHTHSVSGVRNVDLWDALRNDSGYEGYDADRNIAESEFAYLLERGTGIPAERIVTTLDRALKQSDHRLLQEFLQTIWRELER